jgi:hypothetical protein
MLSHPRSLPVLNQIGLITSFRECSKLQLQALIQLRMFSKSWEAVTMVRLRDKLPKRLLDRNKRGQDSKKKRKKR